MITSWQSDWKKEIARFTGMHWADKNFSTFNTEELTDLYLIISCIGLSEPVFPIIT